MSKLFKEKYRTDSARQTNWDYASNGSYFITGCTYQMQCFFGQIKNYEMILNDSGKIAKNNFYTITSRYPHIKLDIEQVMPNHVHAILTIDNKLKLSNNTDSLKNPEPLYHSPIDNFMELMPMKLRRDLDDKKRGGCTGINNPMLHQNISTFVRAYAAKCSIEIRKINPEFRWQGRFHDHIIRNPEEYKKIIYYIKHNPENWNADKFYTS